MRKSKVEEASMRCVVASADVSGVLTSADVSGVLSVFFRSRVGCF